MQQKEITTFYPISRTAWRQWLQENHISESSIWLVLYKKQSNKPTISWEVAVEEALCFGWIDSTRKTIDHERFIQFFSKRKAKSMWSKINKEKVEQLIEKGLMSEAGHRSIAIAKQNGSWTMLDQAEALVIPEDLSNAFDSYPYSREYFINLSTSLRKSILQWLVLAKKPETRQGRITEIVRQASQGQLPQQFR
jgi:uncharacterized protein YdeI (YjbR/CyaY-like superfamily)